MPSADEVEFYLRHYRQITEWAKLESRVHDLMRDAVREGSLERALALLSGESGDAEVDFYVRNRWLITEWNALQTAAGLALHNALLRAAEGAGSPVEVAKRGWTTGRARSAELDSLYDDHKVYIELAWTKQDLLTTRRGYPFPRIALVLAPNHWQSDSRSRIINATRSAAHGLGLKSRGDSWWAHWRMLDGISEGQDLTSYASQCVREFKHVSDQLLPVIRDELGSASVR